MAFSKAHRFKPSDYHFSLLCRALGHPARLAILRRLQKHGPTPVKALIVGMPISKAAASQHLKILREMHILNCEQRAPQVIYWLNQDMSNTYQAIVDLLLRAGKKFDVTHESEMKIISRFTRASAEGI